MIKRDSDASFAGTPGSRSPAGRAGDTDPLGGATVVLTGATSGIGRATAVALADQAGHLILHGLEHEGEVSHLLGSLRAALRPGGRLDYFAADFGDLAAVGGLARSIRAVTPRIDLLVNNAGRAAPPRRTTAATGNEITLQTNYLAPAALTTALLDRMGGDSPGRILNVASATHRSATLRLDDLGMAHGSYSAVEAYARSKLALVTWSCWLAAHLPRPALEVVSLHPGVIATGLLHSMFAIAGDAPEHAAGKILHVASLHADNGTYYDERSPAPPHPAALDPAVQDALHAVTTRLLADGNRAGSAP